MPAVTRDQPLSPSEANSGSIPEAFEDSEGSEDNIGRDGMPDLHRSNCSAEMAWDVHNTYRNTHNRHSSGELRIEVHCRRRTHTCPIPDSEGNTTRSDRTGCHRSTHNAEMGMVSWDKAVHIFHTPDSFVAYVNISHQGLVAVVERQSLSPKSLPRSQFRFRMVSQTPQFRSQKAVLQRKS